MRKKKKPIRRTSVKNLNLKPDIKKEIEDQGYLFRPSNPKTIYYPRPNYVKVYLGFDFLENIGIIEPYICRVYKIRPDTLHMLLYWYPKQIFGFTEHTVYRQLYGGLTIHNARLNDLIEIFKLKKLKNNLGGPKLKNYYCLTKKGRTIVQEYYELLAGVKKMNIAKIRPLKPEDEGYGEYKEEQFTKELINKFNSLPVSRSRLKAR